MKEAKTFKVPANYIVLADLIMAGYTELDAYKIAYPENLSLSMQQNKAIRSNIVDSEKFKDVLRSKMREAKHDDAEIDDTELLGKDETARLIMKSALKLPRDSKERIEGLMKYSDLMGFKKDESEENALDHISFYFPEKCSRCPLLEEYNAGRKKPLPPVEMPDALIKERGK